MPRKDIQGDLFPRCAPATVLLYLARSARRVAQLTDRLTPDDCHQLLGEIALLELRLDRMTARLEGADRFLQRLPWIASGTPAPGPSWIHGPNPPAWAHRARAEAAAP